MSGTARKGLRFRPRARLMSTLGRELISGDTVALTELVKNAYDANAEFVVVRVAGTVGSDGAIVPESGSISVIDDGHGMDEQRIVNTWLEPATDYRRRRAHTATGRRVLGEKGLGRFAAAKLGDQMELTSKVAGGEEVNLVLDWQDFDDDTKYLEDIELDLRVGVTSIFAAEPGTGHASRNHFKFFPGDPSRMRGQHGTFIRIRNLHSRWSSDVIKDVRRSLSMLVSPFAEEKGVVDSFQIYLDVPDKFGAYGGLITSADLLKQHHYSLSAEVSADGAATVLLGLKDDSVHELELKLRNSDNGKILRCGPFEIFLYVWDRDTDSMRKLADHLGGGKLKIARRALDSASGLSIYRDGFRVLPYGELGDDWLGLDARRVQNPTLRLSNNQIVGYILIGRDTNPSLVDQSNREGLVETPGLADLRKVVKELLNSLEVKRYKFRPRRPKKRSGRLLAPIDLSSLRDAVSVAAPDDPRIHGMVDEAQRVLDDRLKLIGEVLARYHRLATLGKLVDIVVHEITQPVFEIKKASSLGSYALQDIPHPVVTQEEELFEEAMRCFGKIRAQTEVVDTVVKRIEPFGGRKRGRPSAYILEDVIAETAGLLALQLSSAGVTLDLPKTAHTVTLDRSELQEILFNLLDNSIYWIAQSKDKEKIIAVSVVKQTDSSLSIVIEDSGARYCRGASGIRVPALFHYKAGWRWPRLGDSG